MGQLPSLEKLEGDPNKLVQALASVKGMTITMRAADKINAQWVIDFEQPVTELGAQVKPFVLEAMAAADLFEPGSTRGSSRSTASGSSARARWNSTA